MILSFVHPQILFYVISFEFIVNYTSLFGQFELFQGGPPFRLSLSTGFLVW